jgi:hypothetical protein
MKIPLLILFIVLSGCTLKKGYSVEGDFCKSLSNIYGTITLYNCKSGNEYINPAKYKMLSEEEK